MKIYNTTNPEIIKAYQANSAEQIKNLRESQKLPFSVQDKVNISDKVQLFREINKEISETPDIRFDKVAEVQQKIQQGIYTADLNVIAEKLIHPNISTKI
ncbi:MAG: flagellar biosynthesis anti-sigma factor FlgM [Deltaproteobacteria bacterium]|nr:flagellar biosynthesis anti-sigma factor FlgM [Deltaproteobacteria bacterium]